MIEIIITILLILVLLLGYTTYNLLIKVEKLEEDKLSYENYITQISEAIDFSKEKLNDIDSRGVFASDDEIGWFFEQIKEIQILLDNFNLKE
jgi:predicted negative regulator of RcsB-dependent stress response